MDYGRKKIGLAVTDESQIVITTLPLLLNNTDAWLNLHQLIQQYHPECIVLGYPSTDTKELSNFQKEILAFQKKIMTRTGIKTILQDESYTSQEAENIYIEKRGKKTTSKKKRTDKKQKIDSIAAHLLLKSYLEIN